MSHSNPLVRTGDVLIQKFARKYACVVCGYQATVGHHMIPRSNMFYRHDLLNILPLAEAYHVGTVFSPHGTPNNFDLWLSIWHRDRHIWMMDNKNVYHRKPDDDDLWETKRFLTAFLKAGKPFVWSAE